MIETEIGTVHTAVRDGALVACWFEPGWKGAGLTASSDAEVDKRLRAYFDGDLVALDGIEVDPEGPAFRRRVWEVMRTIEPGSTMSYGELAARAGFAGAARGVGTTCAKNPVGIVVPCHRVVRSDGSLGGYAGGLDRKKWLLKHERARLV